jgi:hypothetical protein
MNRQIRGLGQRKRAAAAGGGRPQHDLVRTVAQRSRVHPRARG